MIRMGLLVVFTAMLFFVPKAVAQDHDASIKIAHLKQLANNVERELTSLKSSLPKFRKAQRARRVALQTKALVLLQQRNAIQHEINRLGKPGERWDDSFIPSLKRDFASAVAKSEKQFSDHQARRVMHNKNLASWCTFMCAAVLCAGMVPPAFAADVPLQATALSGHAPQLLGNTTSTMNLYGESGGITSLPVRSIRANEVMERQSSTTVQNVFACAKPLYEQRSSLYDVCGVVKIDDIVFKATSSEFDSCIHDNLQVVADADAKSITDFYDDIHSIGSGGEHVVQRARPHDDPEKTVALRRGPFFPGKSIIETRMAILAYSRLSILEGITDLYPKVYDFRLALKRPEEMTTYLPPTALYTEMEYVPDSFEKAYDDREIPDSVVFELIVGDFATAKIARMIINDNKWRHYGLQYDIKYRAYHLGEDIFLLPPGATPRRIDLDIWGEHAGAERESGAAILRNSWNGSCRSISAQACRAIGDIRKLGFVATLRTHFAQFLVEEHELRDKDVKHFVMPSEYLE